MQVECLVLGVIKSISKFHVDVYLPHGEYGRINIYDVNEKYTQFLHDAVKSGSLSDDVMNLGDMFTVGQIVRCYIKEKAVADLSGNVVSKTFHTVSLCPKLVNKHILRSNITSMTHVVGYVESTEDHGYILESGISGITCFLSRDPNKEKLKLASLVAFTMDSKPTPSQRVIKVNVSTNNTVLQHEPLIPLGSLLPGMSLKAHVLQKTGSTILVGFGDIVISVNRAHYTGDEKDYHSGMNVTVCVILIDPATKQIMGSMLPHLLYCIPNVTKIPDLRERASVGTRFANALVYRVDKRTIHVKLPKTKGLKAVIRKAHIPNVDSIISLKSKYEVGTKLTCRIVDHDLFENVAVASMKKKILALAYLSIDELQSNDQVNATINRFTSSGVAVRVGGRLNGLIPYLHLFDVPQKNPAEKLKRGQQICCRVLQVDKSVNKLILTAKPAVVNAQYPVLGSPQMFSLHTDHKMHQPIVTCIVVLVTERGLLLTGVDNMRAWLPKGETGLDNDDVLQANYYQGQVLHVRLLKELKTDQRGKLSTDESVNTNHSRAKYLVSLKINAPTNLSQVVQDVKLQTHPIGQVFHFTVKKVQHSGLLVNLFLNESKSDCGVGTGYLAFDQLSDFVTNNFLLSQSFGKVTKDGTVLHLSQCSSGGGSAQQVVLVNRTKSTLIVSAKPTLLYAAKELHMNTNPSDVQKSTTGFCRSFDDLQVGTRWFGWVAHHTDYGIFIHLPSGIHALAPVRLLCDSRIPAHVKRSDLFPTGATVIAKIVELDPSPKHKCLVSLRLIDTYYAKEQYLNLSLKSVNNWLSERAWLSQRSDNLGTFRIGDLIQFRVDTIDNLLVFGEACKSAIKSNNWVPALAYVSNTVNVQCIENNIYPGIVSFVDLTSSRIEVALSSWLLNSITNRQENKLTELRPGQQVFSVVIAYRSSDVAVVALRGHASGRLGILPTRRSFNDVVGGNAWTVGQRNKVTFRSSIQQLSSSPDLQLCSLAIYDPVEESYPKEHGKQTPIAEQNQVLKLKRKDNLSSLYFHKIVRHTVFFKLNLDSNQLVICRLNNWDTTAKAIRSFLSSPPAVDSLITRTATVLYPAADDKYPSKSHRSLSRSRLAEISFLENNHISVGSLVCVELMHKLHSYWLVRLPAGLYGRLHITSIAHTLKPLDLSQTNLPGIPNIRQLFDRFDREAFLTCRVIDQIEISTQSSELHYYEHWLPAAQDRIHLFFVSNKNHILRDDKYCKATAPEIGVPVGAVVKSCGFNWLLLSITHFVDILVPISGQLQQKLEMAKFKFQIGDFLQVYPKTYVNGHLVGCLLPETQPSDEFTDDRVLSIWVSDILKNLKHTVSRIKHSTVKRKLITTDCNQHTKQSRKRIHPTLDNDYSLPTKQTKNVDTNPVSPTVGVNDQMSSETMVENVCDKQLLTKYQQFMIPKSLTVEDKEKCLAELKTFESHTCQQPTLDVSCTDPAVMEWHSRQLEVRTALLSALTNEQQTLDKGPLCPQTTAEFELAVRNAPSKAAYWTAYISHILSTTNGQLDHHDSLEEARTIAQRAVRVINNCISPDQSLELARVLHFCLIMEAKELERLSQLMKEQSYVKNAPLLSVKSDPVLETDKQSKRVSQILSQLIGLNQPHFIRRAINVLSDVGQHERAEKLARGLVKSSATDVNHWLTLVKVRFRAGQTVAAREAQRNAGAVVKVNQLPQLSLGLARLEFDYGDVDRAIGILTEQLKVTPKRKQLYEECIKLLLLNGKSVAAKNVQKQAADNLKPSDQTSINRLFSEWTCKH